MIRLLIFIITGFWWALPARRPVCVKPNGCQAWRSSCSSGYCNFHCAKDCYCGVGEALKSTQFLIDYDSSPQLALPQLTLPPPTPKPAPPKKRPASRKKK